MMSNENNVEALDARIRRVVAEAGKSKPKVVSRPLVRPYSVSELFERMGDL